MHLDSSRSPSVDILVVSIPYFISEMKLTMSSIFSGSGGSSRLLAVYGSRGWVPPAVLIDADIFRACVLVSECCNLYVRSLAQSGYIDLVVHVNY